MVRRIYSGSAVPTTIVGAIGTDNTPFSVVVVTGWPSGSDPFVVLIDQNLSTEEKVLVTRSGTTLTPVTRGYDNTASVGHGGGAPIVHSIAAVDLDEPNYHINNLVHDQHPQYINATRFNTSFDTRHAITDHLIDVSLPDSYSWLIAADIRVPSGDTDYIPGIYIDVPAGKTVTGVRLRGRINSGTSATVKLQKNGVDIPGSSTVITTAGVTTDFADLAFADLDYIAPVVTAVSATPKNMSLTLFTVQAAVAV